MNNLQFTIYKKTIPILFIVYCLLFIDVSYAQDFGLTNICNGPDCDFGDLITLVDRLINMMIIISTIFAGAAFAWAGVILLTSGGNESAKTKAKDIFKKVMIGYLWILAAWILVYTITTVLLNPGYSLLGQP